MELCSVWWGPGVVPDPALLSAQLASQLHGQQGPGFGHGHARAYGRRPDEIRVGKQDESLLPESVSGLGSGSSTSPSVVSSELYVGTFSASADASLVFSYFVRCVM